MKSQHGATWDPGTYNNNLQSELLVPMEIIWCIDTEAWHKHNGIATVVEATPVADKTVKGGYDPDELNSLL